ncbi:hypothetical protein MKZ38_010091 [Zalerion maritima]|uniref:Sialidase n=1 Tax=Zalerion maritima TaxID=339359 RepID=A0AAD5RTM6_9PEZI|nr:hypothetical protein MKZ38_010091 [Zalerion maritima]
MDNMSNSLVGDIPFDFSSFPTMETSSAHNFSFDPSLLEIPSFTPGHARSSSSNSVFSNVSHASTMATEVSSGMPPNHSRAATPMSSRPTTPLRKASPIRQHGPILLPKIRSQDQAIHSSASRSSSAPKTSKRQRTAPPQSKATTPPPRMTHASNQHTNTTFRSMQSAGSHARSYTNPDPAINFNMAFTPPPEDQLTSSSLLCSPVQFAQDAAVNNTSRHDRGASQCSLDVQGLEKYGFPTYRHMPSYTTTSTSSPGMTATTMAPVSNMFHPQADAFMFPSMSFDRAHSPLSLSGSVEPMPQSQQPTTTLLSHLTAANPHPSLVRTISFPLRDPNTKHFWWDVRQIRQWTSFTAKTIMSLPGALSTLTAPVPETLLPMPSTGAQHPETETQLHSIYVNHYIPRLNAALAASSTKPVQFSLPSKSLPGLDNLIIAHIAGDSASAAAIFGGKPSARVVGLVRSFDRFNTGMRVEGNIKRVEYLRGVAALHHAMREHGCRYGFILTEIELVIVRNGNDATPHFGYLEVTTVQLAATSENSEDEQDQELTACLALWGLAQMAAMDAGSASQCGLAAWKSEIGAPAEGTRRKALPRDDWMPQPQLAEKRESKRSRGWIWPEDPVSRKELGKRGVRYSAC